MNQSHSLTTNFIVWIETFKTNRSARSCEKVKLSDSKDYIYTIWHYKVRCISRAIGEENQWKTIKVGKKNLSKFED